MGGLACWWRGRGLEREALAGELGRQRPPRAIQTRLHGVFAATRELRNLADIQAFSVSELEHAALLVRQIPDRLAHPAERLPVMEAALKAGKHVLSQKPFVHCLADGARLVTLAHDRGVKLAVNQNGRWAPHLSWMRAAVRAGLVGEVIAAHVSLHWNHGWIAGTPFERMEDVILYDFAVHWFDFLCSLNIAPETVVATSAHAAGQTAKVPLLAQVLVRTAGGQASLIFDGGAPFGPWDTTYIAGTKGSLRSEGPDLGSQSVTLTTAAGVARPQLRGTWFNDGFRGAMGALLVAIEDNAEPAIGAAENLNSLALAFAALQSRRLGREVAVGDATRMEG